jgi:hypothetical protein
MGKMSIGIHIIDFRKLWEDMTTPDVGLGTGDVVDADDMRNVARDLKNKKRKRKLTPDKE